MEQDSGPGPATGPELESELYAQVDVPGASLELIVAKRAWTDLIAWPEMQNQARALLDVLADAFDEPLGQATVLLADDVHVQALNKQFRAKDAPTNVLSFPDTDGSEQSGRRLGDLILAAETCQAEAIRDEKALVHHFVHLVVHGLLHLLDFDHTNDADAMEMETLETQLLARLGIPNPYADEHFELG